MDHSQQAEKIGHLEGETEDHLDSSAWESSRSDAGESSSEQQHNDSEEAPGAPSSLAMNSSSSAVVPPSLAKEYPSFQSASGASALGGRRKNEELVERFYEESEMSVSELILPDAMAGSFLPQETSRFEAAVSSLPSPPPRPRKVHITIPIDEDWVPTEWELKNKKKHKFQVIWAENDPENPKQWTSFYRWWITFCLSISVLCVGYCSSAYAGAYKSLSNEFHVSTEVALLGITLFLLGFAFGPLVWAPISEMYGRRTPLLLGFLIFAIFHLPCALATNIQTILISRFLSGIGGSCPMSTAGAVLADLWDNTERGKPMAIFSLTPMIGAVFAPIASGYIYEYLPWQWHFYTMFIFSMVLFFLLSIFLPETYAPILLTERARILRKKLLNDRYASQHEETNLTLRQQLKVALTRPFVLIVKEPMLLCLSLYMAFVYGILYLTFEEFPIVFQALHGWTPGVSGFGFLGIAVGMVLAVLIGNTIQDWFYLKSIDPETSQIPPEARLMSCIGGAILVPLGLWWFAWTATPPTHWIVPILGTVPFGAGMIIIFLGITNYIVDAYLLYAASAIASSSFLRCVAGAAFPLFGLQMFAGMGIAGSTSLLAGVVTVAAPIPLLFYKYGHVLRKKSSFAFD